jgi:cytoskeletal protein CcmA (bactofilin family)
MSGAHFEVEGAMLRSKQGKTVIGQGFKIMGSVTAEGLVQVNGQIEGDLNCTSLIVSPGAKIVGTVTAEQVEVNGTVEGPIHGGDVVLRSKAHVVGDIHHQFLTIGKGAYFEGRSVQTPKANSGHAGKSEKSSYREIQKNGQETAPDQVTH